jgi:hypothetical protein
MPGNVAKVARTLMAGVSAAWLVHAQAVEPLASPIGAAAEPPAPWHVVGLPRQTKPFTRFTVAELDGQRVLRVESDHAYGHLVHPLDHVHAATLTWRWRVDRPIVGADLYHRHGDDNALRVCAMFDMPPSQVPFFERSLWRAMQSLAAEPLATANVCYAWSQELPDGALVINPFTARIRSIVVHGAPGQWSTQTHDLASDFLRAFGDEAHDVPALIGIAIGADADNTGSHSLGYVGDVRLVEHP